MWVINSLLRNFKSLIELIDSKMKDDFSQQNSNFVKNVHFFLL